MRVLTVTEEMVRKHFGITQDLREAGYVLSDGTFIDLSGRHYSSGYARSGNRFVPKRGQPDYLAHQRSVDHRELPEEVKDAVGKRGSAALFAFLAQTGALRSMPGVGFSVVRMPTVESVAAFVNGWKRAYGSDSIVVDILSEEGHTEDSQEIKDPDIEKVMAFMESHFDSPSASLGDSENSSSPQDSIMFIVNNDEALYNDKNGLFDKWVEQGDAWTEEDAREEALAFGRHLAESIQRMYEDGIYRESDINEAVDEMIEEFEEYRDEAIARSMKEAVRKPKPEELQMDKGDIEHAKKYEELAQKIGVDHIRGYMPATAEKVRTALSRGDKYLNSIPLRKWDQMAEMMGYRQYRLSQAEVVALLKHVAIWHFA